MRLEDIARPGVVREDAHVLEDPERGVVHTLDLIGSEQLSELHAYQILSSKADKRVGR